MTSEEAYSIIKNIPLGSKIKIEKKNGFVQEAVLRSHDVSATEGASYPGLEVPPMPPALIILAGTRFGNTRLPLEEVVSIEWVEG